MEGTRNATEVSAAMRRLGEPGLKSRFPEPAPFTAARYSRRGLGASAREGWVSAKFLGPQIPTCGNARC